MRRGAGRAAGNWTAICAVTGLALGLAAVSLIATARSCRGETGPRVRVTTSYESWDQPKAGLAEMTTTFGVVLPAGRSSRVELLGGHTHSTGDGPGSISGLMDTRARLSWLPGEHWAFRAAMNAPTGQTAHDDDEIAIARLLSDRLRGYRGYRVGEGLGADLAGAYSFNLGGASIGLGAGYALKGEYRVRARSEKYDPGDQLRLSLGCDVGGAGWLWRGDLMHTRYGTDQQSGDEVFRLAPRFDLQTSLQHRGGLTTVGASFQTILAGRNEIPGASGLVEEPHDGNPTEYYLQLQISRLLTRRFSMKVFGGGRGFGDDGYGDGKATRADVGVGGDLAVGAKTQWLAQVRYSRASSTDDSGEEQSYTGILGAVAVEVRL